MGNSAVTGKMNSGSHFPYSEENTSMIHRVDDGEGIPASVKAQVEGLRVGVFNQVKTGETWETSIPLIPVSATPNLSLQIVERG